MATIKGNPNFNVEYACKEIFDSINSISKEETKRDIYSENEIRIIDVLTSHDNDQRQNVRMKYKMIYGIDLKDHIKTGISGELQHGLVSLLYTPAEYDARTLNKSLSQVPQKPQAVIEILTTRNSYELRQIERVYNRKFKSDLRDDLQCHENSELSKVLKELLVTNRPNDHNSVDVLQATKDAELLCEAGEAHFTSNNSAFIKVLCEQSFEQLRRTFNIYKKNSGKDISESIKSETSGYYETCLQTIVNCVKDIPRFFAEQIYNDLNAEKTESLVRCLISRSEIDLQIVKQIYEGLYGHSLNEKISAEKFGSYEILLKAIIKK